MVLPRSILPLALTASLALVLPAAAAEANAPAPVAHIAGGDVAPLLPAIVGVPIARTQQSLDKAADAVDAGNGAGAAGPLRASRRYLSRSYSGARYLIAHPPAPAEEASASPRTFRSLARRAIKVSRSSATSQRGWIRAQASDDGPAGPTIADGPTSVFAVFTSQYSAATAAIGMAPDTKGTLLSRVKTTLNTAIILRNRLVKAVHAASPPAPAEDGSANAHASGAPVAASFDAVMPGLIVLLDDELQQMRAAAQDTSVPAASRAVLSNAITADTQIEALVNQYWPPVVDD